MKRLSNLMMKRWKEGERRTERRIEPFIGEEEEDGRQPRDSGESATGKTTPRRKSEPCGQVEEEDEEDERRTERQRKDERQRRRSQPSVDKEEEKKKTWTDRGERRESEGEKGRRKRETDGQKRRRKSESWVEGESQRQTDRRTRETDRWTDRQCLRRRSEPCGRLHVQLLPLSDRKRKELLERRTGRRKSCGGGTDGQTDRKQEVEAGRSLSRRKSEPCPLGNSKLQQFTDISSFPHSLYQRRIAKQKRTMCTK